MAKWDDWICMWLEAGRNMECFEIWELFRILEKEEEIKGGAWRAGAHGKGLSFHAKEFGVLWEHWGPWMRPAVCLVDPRFFSCCPGKPGVSSHVMWGRLLQMSNLMANLNHGAMVWRKVTKKFYPNNTTAIKSPVLVSEAGRACRLNFIRRICNKWLGETHV